MREPEREGVEPMSKPRPEEEKTHSLLFRIIRCVFEFVCEFFVS